MKVVDRSPTEGQNMSRSNRGVVQRPAARERDDGMPDFRLPQRPWGIPAGVLLLTLLAAGFGYAMYQHNWRQRPPLPATVVTQGADADRIAEEPDEKPLRDEEEPADRKPADRFAADRPGAVKPAPFDAKRAMGYLETLCKIGPRMSGTEGMKKQQEMLEKHFTDLGGKVTYQRFNTGKQARLRQQNVDMANMIVSWNPERERRIILCSHYDTRPMADEEPTERLRKQPFISANDGGSGVALLMELAHHMKGLDTTVGVDFVFFDGEEYIWERGDEYFFGSKHFGSEYKKNRGKTQYGAAILLDMVGGKTIHFPIEQNSWFRAEKLVREVWGIAIELRCAAFVGNEFSKFPVEDDHIPLNRSGIPAIDIIDFDYPHWHRATDVPSNCSGESLEQVARVLSVWVQRAK